MARGLSFLKMLKGMRGRRKASNVEPDTAEGVVKGRSQTSTQALNAVLNGQCGTQCRCAKLPHALRAEFRLFKAMHSPLSTERGAGRRKFPWYLRKPQQPLKASPQFLPLLCLVTVEDRAKTQLLMSKLDRLALYLDLAAKQPCVILIDTQRKL